jgi:antitoxin component YwqK of YwqJK toxin-antitoxin module
MRLIFLKVSILLLISGRETAAQDTLYFDKDWNSSPKNSAHYYRLHSKEGKSFIRRDYYVKGNALQMKGPYSSLSPEIKEGSFEWYHPNGKIRHKGSYKKDLPVGIHHWYRDDGKPEATENFVNGLLDGPYLEYHPNGQMSSKTAFLRDVQQGLTTYYYENGKKQSEGLFVNGNRDGEWKYYAETGELQGTKKFQIQHDMPEAGMTIRLPNDEWELASYSDKGITQYIFKRSPVRDSAGRDIMPAIMFYIEDATAYDQDVINYSLQKRIPFQKQNLEIEQPVMSPVDKDYPLPFRNSLLMKAHYNYKELDHIFYMVHVLTPDNKGVQIYMDMTTGIAAEYEKEFIQALSSISEMKK